MSPRVGATVLCLAALLAWPLPMLGFGGGSVPVARFAQLSAAAVRLIAEEGSAGMVGAFAALLGAQALVYGAGIVGLSVLLARRVLPRIPPRLRDHVVVIASTLLISLGVYAQLYDTPFHHTSAHAGLWELYR